MIIATRQRTPTLAKSSKEGSDTEDGDSEDDDDEITIVEPAVGWAYVGSHNFTPSAWGTLSGSAFNPSLNVSMCHSSPPREENPLFFTRP